MPQISVCIATYNGQKYIKCQLKSILLQLGEHDEVIISDDSSTDRTLQIIQQFNDSRIKTFSNNKFASPVFNFENAIKHAKGEYIFLADQDDFWYPDKVKIMSHYLSSYDLVVSNCRIGDENLKIVKESYFEWRKSKKGLLKNILRNSYLGCCMAFRQEMKKDILPFPSTIPMHDMWIGVIAETKFNPVFIEDKLMIYRRHNSNTTVLTDDYKSKESFIKKLKFRYDLLSSLVTKLLK